MEFVRIAVRTWVILGAVFLPVFRARAAQFYAVPPATNTQISEFGTCKVINHNLAQSLFVPTKTQPEWDAFVANKPPAVTLSDCAAPTPRVISTSYYSDWSGTTYKSPSTMSRSNWEISTAGVNNGDLLIIVATIDNGSDTLWPNPFASGFTQAYQKYYGNDGQTLAVAWKIANGEPTSYSGTYVNPSVSYSSVITLLAVSGASASNPLRAQNITFATGSNKPSPVTASSTGVTAPVANCTSLFFASIDWQEHIGTSSFSGPAGYTTLVEKADRGASTWDWTSLQVSFKKLTAAGATGTVSSVETASGRTGIDLEGVIAICP